MQKKIPESKLNRSGDTPFLSLRSSGKPNVHAGYATTSGRSSDSWIILLAAPSRARCTDHIGCHRLFFTCHWINQMTLPVILSVAFQLIINEHKSLTTSLRCSSPITAAGPPPILTGFPIMLQSST